MSRTFTLSAEVKVFSDSVLFEQRPIFVSKFETIVLFDKEAIVISKAVLSIVISDCPATTTRREKKPAEILCVWYVCVCYESAPIFSRHKRSYSHKATSKILYRKSRWFFFRENFACFLLCKIMIKFSWTISGGV